jgi:SHS2 domain-containing protein
MRHFEVIDISGDVGLKAYGKNPEDAFINAALGMYSLITDSGKIRDQKVIDISVKSGSMEGLLVSWMNELIFQFDAYGFIGKGIVITEFTPSLVLPNHVQGQGGEEAYSIKAAVSGEEFDPERHESKLLIKAATYHRLKMEKTDDLWEINVIFDI